MKKSIKKAVFGLALLTLASVSLASCNGVNIFPTKTQTQTDTTTPVSTTPGETTNTEPVTSTTPVTSTSSTEPVVSTTTAEPVTSTTEPVVTTTEPITTTTTEPLVTTTTSGTTTTTPEFTPELYNVIYDGNYYQSITTNMLTNVTELRIAINSLLSSTHTTKRSYSKAFDDLNTIDSYDGGKYVECLYTGEKMDPANHGYWNREHVWAKSHGIKTEDDSKTSDGKRNLAYSDLHHLRATENSINSTRNNRYFDIIDHANPSGKDKYGNYWDSTNAFEPRDEVKGDIARMLFYMDIRYDGKEADQYLDLVLTDDTTEASKSVNYVYETTEVITSYLGKLSTLVKWAYEDPVDSREISRNNAIFTIQGNRNPFIDHPELVYYLYETQSQSAGVVGSTLSTSVAPKLKDNAKITNVDALIEAIGTVTKDSGDAITAARNAFTALDEISKSFVTNYYKLLAAEEAYKIATAVQNTTIDTKFYMYKDDSAGEPGLKGSKEGTLNKNGISLYYKATSSTAPSDSYGIYAQNNKNVTFKASGLYTISKVVFRISSTNDGIAGTVTISDGTTNKSASSTVNKNTYSEVEVDVSELDATKEWTITVTSGSSWRIANVTFKI